MNRFAPMTIIFLTIFLDLVGFGMILPILPFYAESFGASALDIGLLSASFSLMQFIFAPIWGRISDRFGRRPIILMSLFGSVITLVLFGLADSLFTLFAARIFAGIFMANISVAQAYIADITTPENRAKGMGMVGAAFGLGFIFGPTLGGVLSDPGLLQSVEHFFSNLVSLDLHGYLSGNPNGAPAFFAAGLALLNTVFAYFLLPESRPPEKILASQERLQSSRFNLHNLKDAISHPLVGLFLILFFFIVLAFANLEATFALMTEHNFHYDAKNNGYLFAYIGLLMAIVQGGLIGPLTRRFGEGKLLTAGILLQAVAFLFLPHAASLGMLLLLLAPVAIGSGLSQPSLHSLISRNTDADRQGGVLGVNQSLGSLARVFGPTWGGFFFDKLGVAAPYWSGGILLILCAALSMRARSNLREGLRANRAAQDAVETAKIPAEDNL